MKTLSAPAGFWIRFITKILDFIWPIVASVGILFALLVKKQNYQFKEDWGYYVWTIVTITLIIISFIVIPYFTKGRTLAMYITRIKIVPEDENKLLVSLIKREAVFSLSWVFMLLLAMAVINHTLINDFAKKDQSKIDYSIFEKIRMGIISAAGTVVIIIQLIACIGIIIKKDKKGFHDNASNTTTVWINKFVSKPQEKTIKPIQPRPVNDEIVEWVIE